MSKKNNDIEVIIDNNGENLEISPVYEHLKVARPNIKKIDKKNIIIPEVKEKNNISIK